MAFTYRPTKENSNSKAEMLVKNVRVLGAINSLGKFLKPEDKNELATGKSFAGTEKDFKLIAEKQDLGKFKIAKTKNN